MYEAFFAARTGSWNQVGPSWTQEKASHTGTAAAAAGSWCRRRVTEKEAEQWDRKNSTAQSNEEGQVGCAHTKPKKAPHEVITDEHS